LRDAKADLLRVRAIGQTLHLLCEAISGDGHVHAGLSVFQKKAEWHTNRPYPVSGGLPALTGAVNRTPPTAKRVRWLDPDWNDAQIGCWIESVARPFNEF